MTQMDDEWGDRKPAPEPQKVEAAQPALDRLLNALEGRLVTKSDTDQVMASMMTSAIHCLRDDARAELAALRSERAALAARCEDLELMLRAAFPDDGETTPFMTYGPSCDDETTYWVHRNADDEDPINLPDDGTGLPALSAPAREALRRTKP